MSGLLAVIIIPNYIKARITSSRSTCADVNLRLIADAKTRWATDHHKPPGTVPEEADLLPYFKDGKMPTCIAGGTYVIGPIGSNPACSLTNICGAPR